MTDTQTSEDKYEELSNFLRQSSLPAMDRADVFLFSIKADGIDMRDFLCQMITDCDVGRELKKKADAEGKSALVAERFLGKFTSPEGHSFAIVTRGQGHVCLPAAPEKVEQYQVGDPVLVDLKFGSASSAATGTCPPPVKLSPSIRCRPASRDTSSSSTTSAARSLGCTTTSCLVPTCACRGRTWSTIPSRSSRLQSIDTGSNGDELLVDPSRIAKVRRPDVRPRQARRR